VKTGRGLRGEKIIFDKQNRCEEQRSEETDRE